VDSLRRRTIHPFIWLILLLGGIGFTHKLFNQPAAIVRQLLLVVFMIAAVYVIYRLLIRRRIGKEHSSYMKAVHQSKKLHHERDKNTLLKTARAKSTKKGARPSLQRKRTTTHLTVIEGKKGKKKNRAFF
jgi:flagellar biosynthesis/type III secretory pathway M-ring protein FliF/YscJ